MGAIIARCGLAQAIYCVSTFFCGLARVESTRLLEAR